MGGKTVRFPVLAAVICVLGSGCTVRHKESDLLYEFYECRNDEDCVQGWVCRSVTGPDRELGQYCVMECQTDGDCDHGLVCGRQGACTWPELADEYAACSGDEECSEGFGCWWFQFDDPDDKYCLKSCAGDNDCLQGQICGFLNEQGQGRCVDRCYTDQPEVCPAGWGCMLDHINPDATAGYCHPAGTCADDNDCTGAFNLCGLSELNRFVGGVLDHAGQGSACVTGCDGGTTCQAGYKCLTAVAYDLGLGDSLPAICLPTCAEGGVCPPGFRCLRDILEEYFPIRDWSQKDVCFPGLSFVDLPCRSGLQECYHGVCTEHPDGPVSYCAVHCDTQSNCPYDEYLCLDTNGDTVRNDQDFCFKAGCITPGSTDECNLGETCRTFDLVGDARPVCSTDCGDFRQDGCPDGQTCMLSDQGDFGCIEGYQGFPCFDDNDCYDAGLGPVACLGSTGDATDSDRICTRNCSDDAECDWNQRESSMLGYCRGPVCWPWTYSCNPQTSEGLWIPCPSPDMRCLFMGVGEGICTLRCTQSRPAVPEECPLHGGCLKFGIVGSFCFPGVVGVPCAHDSECLDILGGNAATCVSITGADLSVDGTCSLPCQGDEACRILGDVNGFCLPGVTQNGQCFLNPAFDVRFNDGLGLQGSICQRRDAACAQGYTCHSPPGLPGAVLDYCAEVCPLINEFECAAPDHECRMDSNGISEVCVPLDPYPGGRAIGETCYDHRQCEGGICFTGETVLDATDWEGYCTHRCTSTGQSNCPDSWTCASVCRRPGEVDPN